MVRRRKRAAVSDDGIFILEKTSNLAHASGLDELIHCPGPSGWRSAPFPQARRDKERAMPTTENTARRRRRPTRKMNAPVIVPVRPAAAAELPSDEVWAGFRAAPTVQVRNAIVEAYLPLLAAHRDQASQAAAAPGGVGGSRERRGTGVDGCRRGV
jgi:hypothetical protein